jgi:hypothetical protein
MNATNIHSYLASLSFHFFCLAATAVAAEAATTIGHAISMLSSHSSFSLL